jgi:hypothetical protein
MDRCRLSAAAIQSHEHVFFHCGTKVSHLGTPFSALENILYLNRI